MKQPLYTFKRYEIKFVLTREQYENILPEFSKYMLLDEYGRHTICNIYYDTLRYDLIRMSLDKPDYKEKLRLRSYGIPTGDSTLFLEIKKKYEGIVYKRRMLIKQSELDEFMNGKIQFHQDIQIQKEIYALLQQYELVPRVYLAYEREAYYGKMQNDFRVTFDFHVRWRTDHLELSQGDEGKPIEEKERIVMEVKTPQAIPLWMVGLLSKNNIYTSGFSKYGVCYRNYLRKQGGITYVN